MVVCAANPNRVAFERPQPWGRLSRVGDACMTAGRNGRNERPRLACDRTHSLHEIQRYALAHEHGSSSTRNSPHAGTGLDGSAVKLVDVHFERRIDSLENSCEYGAPAQQPTRAAT